MRKTLFAAIAMLAISAAPVVAQTAQPVQGGNEVAVSYVDGQWAVTGAALKGYAVDATMGNFLGGAKLTLGYGELNETMDLYTIGLARQFSVSEAFGMNLGLTYQRSAKDGAVEAIDVLSVPFGFATGADVAFGGLTLRPNAGFGGDLFVNNQKLGGDDYQYGIRPTTRAGLELGFGQVKVGYTREYDLSGTSREVFSGRFAF